MPDRQSTTVPNTSNPRKPTSAAVMLTAPVFYAGPYAGNPAGRILCGCCGASRLGTNSAGTTSDKQQVDRERE
jgi:hypothetical protein